MRPPPRKVDVEVLPPEKSEPAGDPWMRFLADLMDNAFRLPGTNFRFGLDPLLGLLPAFGDTLTGLISAALIAKAARRGIPKIVLARMALNVLANTALGTVPVIGDAFSFWFKSNARNYALFTKHAGSRPAPTRIDWLIVIALVGGLVLLLLFAAIGLIVILTHLSPPGHR